MRSRSELRTEDCGLAEDTQVDRHAFETRTKAFALRVLRAAESLSDSRSERVIARQLLRAGTSVGANYRSACRARSTRDFVAKMGIVEEECDESLYWMELLVEAGIVPRKRLAALMAEGEELLAMVVASIRTARQGKRR